METHTLHTSFINPYFPPPQFFNDQEKRFNKTKYLESNNYEKSNQDITVKIITDSKQFEKLNQLSLLYDSNQRIIYLENKFENQYLPDKILFICAIAISKNVKNLYFQNFNHLENYSEIIKNIKIAKERFWGLIDTIYIESSLSNISSPN